MKKWGNSAAVRIPASVLEAAPLRLDQAVDVREETGRIVISPLRAATFEIGALIAGITDENRHDAVDMGEGIGRRLGDGVGLFPDAGDIVWLQFDPQAGHEQAGHRQAVVLSPAGYNGRAG